MVNSPADVMISLFLSMNLIEKKGDTYRLTDISAQYLVSDKPTSLVPYYSSLKNRPQCLEFYEIVKTGKPAAWSGKKDGEDLIDRMGDRVFADSFTAAKYSIESNCMLSGINVIASDRTLITGKKF